MTSGILTAILLATFAGLVAWAWSRRRQHDFSEASQLPLEDDRNSGEPKA